MCHTSAMLAASARLPSLPTRATDARVGTDVSRGRARRSPKSSPSASCAHAYVRACVRPCAHARVPQPILHEHRPLLFQPAAFCGLETIRDSRVLGVASAFPSIVRTTTPQALAWKYSMAAELEAAGALETQAGGRAMAEDVKPDDVCAKEGDREEEGSAEDCDGRPKLKRPRSVDWDAVLEAHGPIFFKPNGTGLLDAEEGGSGSDDDSDDAQRRSAVPLPMPKTNKRRFSTQKFETLRSALSCAQNARHEFTLLEVVEPLKKDYKRTYSLTFGVWDECTGPETEAPVIEGSSDSGGLSSSQP